MQEKIVKRFLGKFVKLVKSDDFVLLGTIEEVFDDAILFKTRTTSSLISLEAIREIVIMNRGDY